MSGRGGSQGAGARPGGSGRAGRGGGSGTWEWFPPSRPRAVEGGLTARSARGAIGATWWSQRFIAVLESFALGSRLTRGKAYARKGQVLGLQLERGRVTSRVQGSRPAPYRATIRLAPFSELVWAKVEVALAEQAIYAAGLLAGELPPELERVFAKAGAPLFPATVRELEMTCSCPDWEVPCKHLAATFYLLAEAFDDDPFQILHWRGRSRDALLARLRQLRDAEPDPEEEEPAESAEEEEAGSGRLPSGARRRSANEPASGTAGERGARARRSRGGDPDDAARGAPHPQDARAETGAPARPGDPEEEVIGAARALAELPEPSLPSEPSARYWLSPVPLDRKPPTLATDPDLLLRLLPEPARRLGGRELVDLLRPLYLALPDRDEAPPEPPEPTRKSARRPSRARSS